MKMKSGASRKTSRNGEPKEDRGGEPYFRVQGDGVAKYQDAAPPEKGQAGQGMKRPWPPASVFLICY